MRTRRLRFVLVAVLLVTGVCATAFSQEPIPDTLDWHGYFPLEPGNRWQHLYRSSPPIQPGDSWYITLTVIGDTVFGGQSYVSVDSRCTTVYYAPHVDPDPCLGITRTVEYIRYDEEAANVIEFVQQEDPPERPRFYFDFRLDSDFYSQLEGIYGGYYYYLSGLATIGSDTVATTVKGIDVAWLVPQQHYFAHGIGYLGTYSCEGGCYEVTLEYAEIDGVSYGEFRPVSNEQSFEFPNQAELLIYPVPNVSDPIVEFQGHQDRRMRLVVYDWLGRVHRSISLPSDVTGRIRHRLDTAGLASGAYVVVLEGSGRVLGRGRMIVVR